MKKFLPFFYLAIVSLLLVNETTAQKLVEDLTISSSEANLKMSDQKQKDYLVEIAGPDSYYWKQNVESTNEIALSNQQANGKKFPDGLYTLQITPVYKLTAEQRATISKLRAENNQSEIAEFRKANQLPESVDQYVVNFSIRNGKFVSRDNKEGNIKMPSFTSQWNIDHPALYASVNPIITKIPSGIELDRTKLMEEDQVFFDDVIVVGSLCVGQDCVNGESFGFDTHRLKENNLRLHFQDTSNSASFPTRDWRITANDSSNGGSNYLAFEDVDAGTQPFKVEAGAGNAALHVDASGGNIGMGTSTPVVELHVTDGDSPTLRLEQNGSAGFAQQTWDVAGNETNFFVRDVTNGSKLPFKIKPGAPDNSIFIAASGNIGIRTANPEEALHVATGDVFVENGSLGIGTEPTAALDVLGNTKVTGESFVSGKLGIGIDAPIHKLHVYEPSSDILTTVETDGGHASMVVRSATAFKRSRLIYQQQGASNHWETGLSNDNSDKFYIAHGANFTDKYITIRNNGNVGIGVTNPNHRLQVGSDDVVKPTAGGWLGASDRRLKENIVDFNDGLEAILKINPVKYRFNGKLGLPTHEEHIGVIAQEIQKIAPYTVKPLNNQSEEGKNENYLAYDGTALTYLLVNAVQEQQELIEEQNSEIQSLKAELTELHSLKSEVAALARLMNVQKNDKGNIESSTKK